MKNNLKKFFDRRAKKWDSFEHTDINIIRSLVEQLNIRNGDSVLDVGCGTGIITGILQELSSTYVDAIDISDEMIKIAKRKYQSNNFIHFICEDLYTFKTDKRYDFLVIYNAYPHFLDPKKLSQVSFSLLKENGHLVILHSLSKEELKQHHNGPEVSKISRIIDSPQIEYIFFQNEFELFENKETEHSYYLNLIKK